MTLVDFETLVALGNTSEAPSSWMDNSTLPLIRLVQAINLYLIPVISGVGIVGGVCSCLVFTFTRFQYQPCSQYLAVLTASDSGFLIALLIGWLTTLHPNLATTPGYCQVMVYMTYTCSFLSAWYLVLLMLERYIAVCHPLRAPVLCTKRHARAAIGFVTLLALLLYLHSFFTTDWALSSVDSPCKQKERYLQFLTIFTYVDFLVTFALPFTLILTLNLRIILAVRSFRRRHRPLRPGPGEGGGRGEGGRGEGEGGGERGAAGGSVLPDVAGAGARHQTAGVGGQRLPGAVPAQPRPQTLPAHRGVHRGRLLQQAPHAGPAGLPVHLLHQLRRRLLRLQRHQQDFPQEHLALHEEVMTLDALNLF